MSIPESILAGLQRLQRANRPLDMLNLFKGAPIVYPAFVVSVEAAEALVRVPSFEIVCLMLEPTTILLSQLLEEAVSAHVLAVDLPAGQARLGQLQYASHHVGDRMTVRVAPRQPIQVPFECGGVTLRGELTDVSINGLGLRLPAQQAGALRPRAVVSQTLPLPQPVTAACGRKAETMVSACVLRAIFSPFFTWLLFSGLELSVPMCRKTGWPLRMPRASQQPDICPVRIARPSARVQVTQPLM